MAIAGLAVCLGAAAQTSLSVDQLVSFIRSSMELKHPDKQLASYLAKVKLSEQLDDRTIEELQGHGAGPKTVEALRELRDASKSLPKPKPKAPKPAPSPVPPPSPEEQRRAIEEVRQYAINYTKHLPDFICTQVTRRYADPTGLEFWQTQDVITAQLSYFEQKEDYKLVLVNNRAITDRSYHSLSGATSTGEFGSLLRLLFEKETRAEFQWERWATLRGKRTHVFSYRVAQPHSQWHISYERQLDIVAGYRGLLYVDRDTDMVLRVTLEAEDIPPSFPVQQASTMLDYDYTKIADREYLLPLKAAVRMRHDKLLTKNDVEFRMYRKFSAEAVIKLTDIETPPPLPESQIKEQPPK
jgi:hypothetical protein